MDYILLKDGVHIVIFDLSSSLWNVQNVLTLP